MRLPAPLRPGAAIGIVAPSGAINDRKAFETGVRILGELGYKTIFPRDLWPGSAYLADTDSQRMNELVSMWHDNEIDAVMAARGGYGCLRMLEHIRLSKLSVPAKLFIGFSDITLLHNYLNEYQDVVTMHGPVVTSLAHMNRTALLEFGRCLQESMGKWQYRGNIEVLQGTGTFTGKSTGGNLSTIVSTIGTPYQPDWRKKIVFLEDTAEHAYKVDRMLTQLSMAGMFRGISGIILGDFSHGLGLDRNKAMQHHEAIWQRTLELVPGQASQTSQISQISVWAQFPMGHGDDTISVPLGMPLMGDNDTGSLASTWRSNS